MNAQNFRSLHEAYLDVYQLDEKENSEYENASDAALDARYGYGRAQGDKRSFGRAANRASAAAMLRRLRRDRDEGRETSRESGADAVHQGWAHTARTSEDQTPEKKAKRKKLADTSYSDLPDDEQEKDRVSADAVRAVYNRNKKRREQKEQVDIYDIILSHLLDEGYAETSEEAEVIMVNMSEDWRDDIVDEAYVDYRRGRLPSGRTPRQALRQRRDRNQSRAETHANHDMSTPENPDAKKFKRRASKAGAVEREMAAHTSFGGVVNKLLSPGLGDRAGAGPRVAYGEPNTSRHQLARWARGERSIYT